MTLLTPRVLRALGRFNDAHPWDHNRHYHPWILRQLPRRVGRALDVGAGTGELARGLGRRAGVVVGVDADPGVVVRARELTGGGGSVRFEVGDALGVEGEYDVVTCVAVLHHLPFGDALRHFRGLLAPDGTLVVVGLYRAESAGDRILGAVAIPLNVLVGWVRNKGRPGVRPVSMTAPTRAAEMTYGDIVRAARLVLPGARLRRRLFWRYTLVWRRPG
ncbi:class I SAM-dependent methyltransferase [Streptomyces sp. NPDC006512]|uniref:class I SAM-dependent methyltransferase n=1 Tax=Streptomyces sp. NPDC006512 TaxID=3154307 RepID=UPI0033BD52B3